MKKQRKEIFFTALLMQWHVESNKRKMPWKGEKDPYKIWLSEIILQQTRVEQGMNYYLRFINRYPTVYLLAAAPDNEVFKLWEGLGYYNRCRNLLAAARHIVDNLEGKFPETYDGLLSLKGVGAYTASAIAAFAYDLPYAVVDGNVNRVLARFFAIDIPIDSTLGKPYFSELANQLLDKEKSASYNQVIMDFGATVCKPQLPLCEHCVLQDHCKAYRNGMVNELPVKLKKIKKIHRWFYYILAEHKNGFLVKKRMDKDIWQSLHEFVLIEANNHLEPADIFASAEFKAVSGKKYKIVHTSAAYKQQLTHQTIHAIYIHIKVSQEAVLPGMKFIRREEMSKLAFPRLINTFLEQYFAHEIALK